MVKIFYMLIIVVVTHLVCLLKLIALWLLMYVNYPSINLTSRKAQILIYKELDCHLGTEDTDFVTLDEFLHIVTLVYLSLYWKGL